MIDISLTVAFIAGLVSFLSPCVLPIIPGFLAYLAGTSFQDAGVRRREIFLNSFFFVLGFSVLFAVLGVLLNSIFQAVAPEAQTWLARIGGVVIIFFGLSLVGLVHIPFLERTHTFAVKKKFNSRYLTSFFFGFAFAAGWTPCVGAALGAILGLAAAEPSRAFLLLVAYALGLGIPFLLAGLFAAQARGWIGRYTNAFKYASILFGAILIILGVLVFTESLNLIANFEFLNRLIL